MGRVDSSRPPTPTVAPTRSPTARRPPPSTRATRGWSSCGRPAGRSAHPSKVATPEAGGSSNREVRGSASGRCGSRPATIPGEAGWHTTATIDVDVVLSGRLELSLPDTPPVVLGPGEAVVQRGTHHKWRPVGDEPVEWVALDAGRRLTRHAAHRRPRSRPAAHVQPARPRQCVQRGALPRGRRRAAGRRNRRRRRRRRVHRCRQGVLCGDRPPGDGGDGRRRRRWRRCVAQRVPRIRRRAAGVPEAVARGGERRRGRPGLHHARPLRHRLRVGPGAAARAVHEHGRGARGGQQLPAPPTHGPAASVGVAVHLRLDLGRRTRSPPGSRCSSAVPKRSSTRRWSWRRASRRSHCRR